MSSSNSHNHSNGTAHFVVLSVSDNISVDHDKNGRVIEDLVHEAGHDLVYRRIVKKDEGAIREAIAEALADDECDVIVTSGGAGLSKKDVTARTISSLYDEEIPGFGELFRYLSFKEIGSSIMSSRACAGIVEGCPVFTLPGATGAVRTGMTQLVLPELGQILHDLGK